MNVALPSPRPWLWDYVSRGLAGLFVAMLMLVVGAPAHAAPPPAGTSISNQASATYSDGSGVGRTVTSNLVQTTVTQVYALTLTQNGAQSATPGSIVYYPHTLTNTGNGTDTFNLAASSGTTAFTMSSVLIYADNGSGQITGSPITSSGALASGATFKFIVAATVPATATAPQTNAVTVTATSGVGTSPPSASNTDTTTVTANAVVTLTKSISAPSGAPGSGPYTYRLTYTNTGNSDATAVVINDAIPTGMTYVPASGRWSVTGSSVALSDSGAVSGTSPNTLTSTFTAGAFTVNIAKVTAGQSGWVEFSVNVGAVAPGVISNTGTVQYYNGSATANGSSNRVDFTVTQTAGVTLTPPAAVASAAAGSTVSFTNVVTNTGNGTDTFNITLAASNTFPSGTTFALYKSDGSTPLVDTNGDGTIDTGPLAAGATYNVILKATLPPSATGAGPFAIAKTATSVRDNTKTSTGTDTLTAITPAAVDLMNDATHGNGPGPEAAAVVKNATNPGTVTTFTLQVKNTGPTADTFDMLASNTTTFPGALPSGWSVVFKADASAGACTTTGASLTNTGTINAAATTTVCAVVTVPAGYPAGDVAVYFRAKSPSSNAADVLYDAVTVNAVRSLSLTPNGAGQTYPGGSYVYKHTLTNNGNVVEAGTTTVFSTLAPVQANNTSGWSSTLYFDSNGNGTLDATDTLVTGNLNAVLPAGGLAIGQSVTLFEKVIAPSGATPGSINATTITINTTNGTYTSTVPAATVATDSTTVIAGNLTLVKEQQLDATCAGTTTGTWTQGNLSAAPGTCVMYRITVTNVGAADATGVVISDATPTYTTISTVAATASPGQVTGPALNASGTITAYIGTGANSATPVGGTLAAGASATVTFGVKITP
ncbi:DUF11 domain-containing protein [Ramlibacter sp. G-1-2-2]|uniref:DUF11 domain-containing protein n=1 Tax=Ramlibacter agri TaxID=2728837 RepID=A0A848HA83_9BURK|nr:DUF11 domain-containing protein [Ramlibacter agri]NML46932.1 DUF11 domain-containing protein [Ramlibacter agri]